MKFLVGTLISCVNMSNKNLKMMAMASRRYAGRAVHWLEVKALKMSRHGVEVSSTPEHSPCTENTFNGWTISSESRCIAWFDIICRCLQFRLFRISSFYHMKTIPYLLHTHLFCHRNRSTLFIKSFKKTWNTHHSSARAAMLSPYCGLGWWYRWLRCDRNAN